MDAATATVRPPEADVTATLQRVAQPEQASAKPFEVEAEKPEAWFDTFKQAQQGELPRRGFSIGEENLGDGNFQNVRTDIKVVGKEDAKQINFLLTSTFNYPVERIMADGGFHSVGTLVKIADSLRSKGVKIKFGVDRDGLQVLTLSKDGVECIANLGYSLQPQSPSLTPSEMGKLHEVWKNKRIISAEGWKPFSYDADSSEEAQEVPSQNVPVTFELKTDEREAATLAKTPEDLAVQVKGYTAMLGEFVKAYYLSRGIVPPSAPLKLAIPDWNTYVDSDPQLAATGVFKTMEERRNELMGGFGNSSEVGQLLSDEERSVMPTFAEVGGQPQAVEEARKLVMAIRHADIYAQHGVARPRGILLEGPPGTGKTLLAKAVAREAGAEFISLKVTDLVSKWFGEAEQNVQKFFDRARALTDAGKDVIAFIDEIDAVAPDRQGAYEATQKMVSIFLQNIDGMTNNPRLTILGATNHPEKVDDAFRRPGRFDKQIEVELPDASGRAQILAIKLKEHLEKAKDKANFLAPDLDITKLVENWEGVSGADLESIVNLASEEKVTATIRQLEGLEGGRPWAPLSAEDLRRAKETYIRSSKNTDIDRKKPQIGFRPPEKIAA